MLSLVVTAGLTVHAETYYVSNAGNDNNDGLTTSTPWKTLAKVSSFYGFVAGDEILFNRDEVYYGRLTINNSGTSGNPITIGAYGSGAMPVISGFITVSSWTNLGNNIWESTNSVSTLPYVNIVVVNGVNTAMGRFPNTGFYTYQSYVGNTSITSSNLTGSTNWTGAELVSYSQRAGFSKAPITSQSGGTLTYTPSPLITVWDHNVPQFFIQNDPRTLDVQNEWYFNKSTKKIRIYSAGNPSNVQVANIDTLVYLNGRNYITFENISFQGSNIVSLGMTSSNYISILNCDFNFSGRDAINAPWVNASTGLDIENNTINHSNNNAIYLTQICNYATIRYNTITNSGVIPGMTNINNGIGFAIVAPGSNTLIEYNTIDSVGYSGIKFFGSNTKINNNFLRNFCLILRDGGGIYTWNGASKSVQSGIKVLNNVVVNNNVSSNLNTENYGIYIDDLSNNIEITGNTTANCGWGIELHSVFNVTVKDNTAFHNSMASILLMSDNVAGVISGHTPMDNIVIKNNIFFAKTKKQMTLWLYPLILPIIPPALVSDSNYFARPVDNGTCILTNYQPKGGTQQFATRTLSNWQSYSLVDAHSKGASKAITDTNDLRFEYNATNFSKTVSLPYNYIDVRGVNYNGSITLAPWTSAVLTRNGPATNQSPKANAGSNQTITLPANSVNLSGSGTDPDGTISAYNWTKISGPSPGTIANANAASTAVTGLVQGVYKFQLQVTDNDGAAGFDTAQVTVNSAGNSSPTANAGGDQTIDASTTTLNGSGTDQDGAIASYAWSKISGPSATIVSPGSASTVLTGLVEGMYQFQLKVTDNKGATGVDVMTLTVNSAGGLHPAVNPGNTVNGLDYSYYESDGGYSMVPDFSTLTPVKTGTSAAFDISQANRPSAFAFNFTGFIDVPSDGQYTFFTTSDDGSTLYIDNVLVANNDGLHSPAERSGNIGLQAGKHSISVGYFNQSGDSVLTVNYAGPGISKQAVPLSALFRISQLLPAVNPGNTVNGLDYSYYESDGGYSMVPDFSTLTAIKTGTSPAFDISLANRSSAFAFNFTGFIDVPSDGQYTFFTNSDDGSTLYIDNVLVANNDGLHSLSQRSGTIGLQAGKHAISVGYFNQSGSAVLTVSYAGPGISQQDVPVSSLFRISELLPAVNPANTVNGLDYDYYESDNGYSVVPDFSTLTPVKSGISSGFDISIANRSTAFALNFTGFINVPSDGQYTFFTTSDDGSNLYIDNVLVVNNDGLHESAERSGTIGLEAGKHTISVGYFEQAIDSVLSVSYVGPGISKQTIPASSLFRISGLLPAVNPANTVNGLNYDYYESGSGYSVVPDFPSLTPVKSGTSAGFDISLANRSIAFAFNFTGFINVPSDGQYTFFTTSDDGSNLYIDNLLLRIMTDSMDLSSGRGALD